MERAANFLILLLVLPCMSLASQDGYHIDIYDSYVNNEMDRWKSVMDKMAEKIVKSEESLEALVNYQYGYIAWCIGNHQDREAKEYLELAEANLRRLEVQNSNASLINAYKAAFYGFKIGLNRYKAPFYGPKGMKHAELSIEQDASNPLGYIQYGNALFYMPAIFGGSKTEAIGYYKKAQELMELNAHLVTKNWNYLNVIALIAIAYEESGQFDKAVGYCEMILSIEPEFIWIKDELYPSLLERMQ